MALPLLGAGLAVDVQPFTPATISGLQLWLDASDSSTLFTDSAGTTPATADGDPIGRWADKSGNARHATQSDGTKKPALTNNAKNTLPAITYDGVNDCLIQTTSSFVMRHCFAVVFIQSSANVNTLLTTNYDGVPYPTNAIRRLNSSTWGANNPDDWCPNSGYRINGVATNIQNDGTWSLVASARSSNFTGIYNLSSQYSRQWNGKIGEIVLFDSVISGANLTSIENYFNNKWSVY